jgi:hypothetical protein
MSTAGAVSSGCAFPILHADEPEREREPRRERRYARTYARTRPPASHASTPMAVRATSPQARWPATTHAFGPPPSPEACFDRLQHLGVAFAPVSPDEAPGVREPLRLRGPVAGVVFEPANGHPTHAIIDCRLVLALHAWAAELRRAGVWRVEHYSIYRPFARVGGSGSRSGHASALAIDAARFTLDDGSVLDVLTDWEDRSRGNAPCPARPDEALGSRILRGVTCAAVDDGLFQVVITPHHDRAHENHAHLEWKPNVDWTYVR